MCRDKTSRSTDSFRWLGALFVYLFMKLFYSFFRLIVLIDSVTWRSRGVSVVLCLYDCGPYNLLTLAVCEWLLPGNKYLRETDLHQRELWYIVIVLVVHIFICMG